MLFSLLARQDHCLVGEADMVTVTMFFSLFSLAFHEVTATSSLFGEDVFFSDSKKKPVL